MYPDSKILSRELRKVSREAKQEIKKAESSRKNSKKMFKILNKFHAFKIDKISSLQAHYRGLLLINNESLWRRFLNGKSGLINLKWLLSEHAIKSFRIFFSIFLIQKSFLLIHFYLRKKYAPIPDQEYTYIKTLNPEAVGGIELLRRF